MFLKSLCREAKLGVAAAARGAVGGVFNVVTVGGFANVVGGGVGVPGEWGVVAAA